MKARVCDVVKRTLMSISRLLRMEKLQLGRVNAFMHRGTMHCKRISRWTMSFEIQEKIELVNKEFEQSNQWRKLRPELCPSIGMCEETLGPDGT